MYVSMSDIARASQEGGRDRKELERSVGNVLFLREILCGTNSFLYYYVRLLLAPWRYNAPYLYTSIVNYHQWLHRKHHRDIGRAASERFKITNGRHRHAQANYVKYRNYLTFW